MSSEINYKKNGIDILEIDIRDLNESNAKDKYWDICCKRCAYFSVFIVICYILGYISYRYI